MMSSKMIFSFTCSSQNVRLLMAKVTCAHVEQGTH